MQDLIISNIVTFLVSGGLTTLVTLKFARRDAEATAMEKVQRIYQTVIADLNADRERLKEQNRVLAEQNGKLSEKVNTLRSELDKLKEEMASLRRLLQPMNV